MPSFFFFLFLTATCGFADSSNRSNLNRTPCSDVILFQKWERGYLCSQLVLFLLWSYSEENRLRVMRCHSKETEGGGGGNNFRSNRCLTLFCMNPGVSSTLVEWSIVKGKK